MEDARRLLRSRSALGGVCFCLLLGLPLRDNAQSEDHQPDLRAIRTSIDDGRYAEAEQQAQSLISSLENGQTGQSEELAQAIDLLVESLVWNGKGAERRTRALAEQTIRTREARHGPNDVHLSSGLRNLGDALVQAGEYRLARLSFERGLRIRENGDDLDRLARVLTFLERYDEALAASDRALQMKENALARDDVRIARTLETRALLLQRRGDYPRAGLDLDRAWAIRESTNPTHPEAAGTLSLKGVQRRVEGDPVRAKEFSSRALAVAQQSLRPDHPDIATYMRLLAIPVAALGDLPEARILRERALAIAKTSLGPDHLTVAVYLNDLATSLFAEGEYARARTLFEEALRTYERNLGPNHTGVTTAVYNLAVVSASLGDVREARRQYNRAISTWSRVVGPEHPFVALAVSQLAQLLSGQGLHAEARTLYERALAIRERTLGKNHTDVATILTRLSVTMANLGHIREAYQLTSRALKIWEQSSGRDTHGAADALIAHGAHQLSQGDHMAARNSYDQAMVIVRRILGDAHPDVADVQASLALALVNMGQVSEGVRNALDVERISRGHLRLILRYLPEREALAYAAKRPKGLDLALSVSATDPRATTLLLDASIRGRALTLDEMAARRHQGSDASRPEVAPLWKALTSARQRLANVVVRGPSDQQQERYLALVEEARREKEIAERELAERSATFTAELARTEIGLQQVRAALPPSSALVSFVRYDRTVVDATSSTSPVNAARSGATIPAYIAFVLRSGESQPLAIPLGSAQAVDALVARWRTEIATGMARSADAPQEAAEKSLRATGATLRQRVWDPIAKQLHDVSRVFVVPDGALNLVPLAALPVGQTGYLLEEGPVIHYISAERDLVTARDAFTAGRGLLAFGGPAFEEGTLFAALAKSSPLRAGSSPPVAMPTLFRGVRSGCGSFQSMRFPALPASRREADEVAGLWKEFQQGTEADLDRPQVLAGRDANERTFKQLGPGSRVLHLATHGFFLGNACASGLDGMRAVGGLAGGSKAEPPAGTRENPLLLSGLALAGANRRIVARPDEEDGILTAEEVASVNLEGVEWAVLSACDTGLGELKVGEGVFGLRRAFQVAGVRTVIMSLWSVEDRAARQWMLALYRGRLQRRLHTADAVREASLTVLRDRRAGGQTTHPFYWAGFVAAGDWR
jgi:CHAT domain-containing protein/Tfp pilus assembly protein PilF